MSLLLLLLLKKVGSATLRESDVHPISPKTTAPQYQPVERKKRRGKRVEDNSRDSFKSRAFARLLKPTSPTPSNTGLARAFQRDTEKGIKVQGRDAQKFLRSPQQTAIEFTTTGARVSCKCTNLNRKINGMRK